MAIRDNPWLIILLVAATGRAAAFCGESLLPHVGLCAEFPGMSWRAASPDAAFSGIRRLVAGVLLDMNRSGERPPQPLATRAFSGKFMVRVPPDVHRKLAIEATEAGVSILLPPLFLFQACHTDSSAKFPHRTRS